MSSAHSDLPRLVHNLLRWSVPDEYRDDVIGDLIEFRHELPHARSPLATSVRVHCEALRVAAAFQWIGLLDLCFATRSITTTELRCASRQLRRHPLMALATLAGSLLGLSLSITAFTMLVGLFDSHLPFDSDQRFVRLDVASEPSRRAARLDLPRYQHFSAAESFVVFGAEDTDIVPVVSSDGSAEPVRVNWLTPQVFAHLRTRPLLGRLLEKRDAEVGAQPVALVRESLWRRRLDADPAALGSTLQVNGIDRVIVGVVGDSVRFPSSPEVWLPLDDFRYGGDGRTPKSGLMAFGVLVEGATPRQATLELRQLDESLTREDSRLEKLHLDVVPFTQRSTDERVNSRVFVAVLVLLLSLVASNLAHLTLARSASRLREFSIRTALGAQRARLVIQLCLETLAIWGLSATVALALSRVAIRFLQAQLESVPFWVDFGLGPKVLGFTLFAACLGGAISGILPALQATRETDGVRSVRIGRASASRILTGLQVAAAVLLLSLSLSIAQSVSSDSRLAGDSMHGKHVLTARLDAANAISGGDASWSTLARFLEELRNVSGVHAVAATRGLPGQDLNERLFEIEGGPDGEGTVRARTTAIGDDLFRVLEAETLAGRTFRAEDFGDDANPVAVITRDFAKRSFGSGPAVGRRIRLASPDRDHEPWVPIVGVVSNLGFGTAGDEAAVLFPWQQPGLPVQLALRTELPAEDAASLLWTAVAAVGGRLQLTRVQPLSELGTENHRMLAALSTVLLGCGVVVLLLSAMSLSARTAFDLARRSREMGIRLALGASRGTILKDLATGNLRPAFVGGVIGVLAVAAVAAFELSEKLLELPQSDLAATVVIVLVVLAAAGIGATWWPARRLWQLPLRRTLDDSC